MVDARQLEQHLVEADIHVTQGLRHITRQRELVAELERDHHDCTSARALLSVFEQLQATHEAIRERLRRDLSAARRDPVPHLTPPGSVDTTIAGKH